MTTRWLRALPPLAILQVGGRKEQRAVHCEEKQPTLSSRSDYPQAVMQANGWHFAMLRDEHRARQFESAIQKAVTSGDLVLDVGAGTGLLGMMAKKAGGEVYACEGNSAFADVARRVQRANGLEFPIFAKTSQSLEVGPDLPRKVDVLVGEVLSSSLFGEGILATFRDAHRRLLRPGAKVLPRRARLHFAVVEWDSVYRGSYAGQVAGLDLSAFNAFRAERRLLELPPVDGTVRRLTAATVGIEVDFGDPSDPLIASASPLVREFDLPVLADGICQLVMVWWDADLTDDGDVQLSTDPFQPLPAFRHGHWGARGQVLPLAENGDGAAANVRSGDKVRVRLILRQDRPDPQPYFTVAVL
ncbi:unnamed protein product [Polarella glacialis]|uniref:Protein arginine N-methyltransferase n=1 Tax=Polarella glacialis TaxID=89957 RepID=A0A813KLA3_POLGL|nr:unnamed protein product [Polarella glacialis]|mmetsp:Transcript_21181/g.33808  ORF Transcript_21181/g.33808 Transcript_21181/m.33808 type:complete len:358 (+) Transcript_21181:130-1203(+)|eukprot:CAMPEP_0115093736 /NCGR_PEP_ID=MMETSP0227-20121206/27796_1 /TAXON_ID=89957 /ORGANISM="Polarella glacialis, Strain CCMP 1383" /LENGTH=357 /DNA_ID=CAMNT_0002486317 /DNA_START=83 /DNA_END=1156 /DNA_ORIENTATION=+